VSSIKVIGRNFDYVRTQLVGEHEGDTVDDLYVDGYAPLNGGGWAARRKGRAAGRIWHRVTEGDWLATPETSVNWADLQWYGPFKSRAEAAMFLAAIAIDRPQTCPCCRGPVIIGPLLDWHLYRRDGITYHACGDR
jgi:hypothetical protein